MHKYVPPELKAPSFTCPFCGVYSQQHWSDNLWHRLYSGAQMETVPINRCYCVSCQEVSFWSTREKIQIYPKSVSAPMPHANLPDSCKGEYLEARNVAGDSPRAAAALLRLCIQKLLLALGGKGRNIDEDIASLVAQGLPTEVKDALDFCRVIKTGKPPALPG